MDVNIQNIFTFSELLNNPSRENLDEREESSSFDSWRCISVSAADWIAFTFSDLVKGPRTALKKFILF